MHDSSSRNVGLDLVRNLAIFLVVVQHIVFLGGLGNDAMGALHKIQARFIEALSQSCVDIFGMLSGYLGVTATTWKWRRFAGARPGWADWRTALLPLCHNEYWYFTAYLLVFMLAPLVNRFLFAPGCEKRGFVVAILLFLVAGDVSVFPGDSADHFFAKGYSAEWLLFLYVMGAALRCGEGKLKNVRPWCFFAIAAFGVVLTAGQRFAMAAMPALKDFFDDEWTLCVYTSPTVTLTAAALLLGCAHLSPKTLPARFWSVNARFAACAFGVYLFHVQPFFFNHVFKGAFHWLDRVPDVLWGAAVLGTALGVYIIFGLLERLRGKVLARLVAGLQKKESAA